MACNVAENASSRAKTTVPSERMEMTPNDLKLSDSGVRRGTCAEGGKAAAEAGAVTHGAVRCSAWLGVMFQQVVRTLRVR